LLVLDQTKLRAQVERLAASAEFARADRMVQFLRYVVEKTLEGETIALRERQIGIEVFERPLDWDPKLDNIVRSEARRLRGKLEAYAASNNPDETIRITMPTGGYGVRFEELSPQVAPAGQPPEGPLGQPTADSLILPQRPSGHVAEKRAWFYLFGVVSLLAVLFAVLHHRPEARDDENNIEPLSSEAGLQFSPAISPDNKQLPLSGTAVAISSISIASRLVHRNCNGLHTILGQASIRRGHRMESSWRFSEKLEPSFR
jgi:hypothetical protein